MPMNILVLGANGMLGHRLIRCLGHTSDFMVTGTVRKFGHSARWFTKDERKRIFNDVDVTDYDKLMRVFAKAKPDVVINCIGIIKQLPVAKDPLVSIAINALFPHRLALACEMAGARLIHFSTDCVFSGKQGNYAEEHFSDAGDLYGKTKYLGEVTQSHCLTLRTSIIGHELNSKFGLVEWFLSQKGPVNGFKNAIYSGFPTVEIARIVAQFVIPRPDLTGLYHVSSDAISKFELLKLIADIYKMKTEVNPNNEFHCDRSLDSSRFKNATDYQPPAWPELIRMMHRDFLKFKRAND